ncbi:MAG: hypothetical protein ACI8RZ_004362 [Myxococcota bacterium]
MGDERPPDVMELLWFVEDTGTEATFSPAAQLEARRLSADGNEE